MLNSYPLDGKLPLAETPCPIPYEAFDRYRREAVAHTLDLMAALGQLSREQKAAAEAFQRQ